MAKAVIKIQEIRDQTQWVRLGMLGIFVVLMALILPKQESLKREVLPGSSWQQEDLVAKMDFARPKAKAKLEEELRQVTSAVPPVMRLDTLAQQASLRGLATDAQALRQLIADYHAAASAGDRPQAEVIQSRLKDQYSLSVDSLPTQPVAWEALLQEMARQIYMRGLADSNGAQAQGPVLALRKSASRQVLADKTSLVYTGEIANAAQRNPLPKEAEPYRRMMLVMLSKHLKPQYVFDRQLTEEARKSARDNVMTVEGKITKGDVLVRHGELVSEETAAVITAYQERQSELLGNPGYLKALMSQLALIGMITLLMAFYLQSEWPRIYYRNRKLAFLLLLLFLTMSVAGLALKLTQVSRMEQGLNFIFLTPVCMVPIVLTAFFDTRLGFFGNLVITIFIALVAPNGVEYLFVQFSAGTIAVYSLREMRSRGEFFLSLFFVLLAYLVSYLGYVYFLHGGFQGIHWGNLALLAINVVLTIIAFPLIYLFERIFGLTSDMTYIELLDTHHPLLKDLAIKAPGTFQHSLQVAHITEAVLTRIGGNALLGRVGALYHDIGKARNPRYFIENQGDEGNPHEEMEYEQSAEVIIRHVTDGIKMAQDARLPNEIIHFIRTHHGTSRVEYFYRKHLEDHPEDDDAEGRFSYPGPLPFSREMAVLMICDGAEAACRAMKHRTPDSVKALVENMVKTRVRQNQFEAANITFRDLEDIKQVVYTQLLSIYHGRIEYPPDPE